MPLKISPSHIWQNQERRVLQVFKRALELLCEDDNLDVCEDELNRRLLFYTRKADAEYDAMNDGLDTHILYEANNQPVVEDIERAQRENKRPDFTYPFKDLSESNPDLRAKSYTIECKRLGNSGNPAWVFNKNYVEKGIQRFVTIEHGYGKGVASGLMIGYVRNMSFDDILKEVNGYVAKAKLNFIQQSKCNLNNVVVSRFEEKLDRPKVLPTPFPLRHLWVDLRKN